MGALIAVLALATGLRVLAWHNAAMMMNDGPNFLWQAQRLLEGDWVSACSHPYHPLYGALAALASFVTGGDVALGGLAVSVISGLLVCTASWGLAKLAFPDTPGAPVGAALVAAVTTRLLDATSDIQGDGLFAALSLCTVWAVVAAAARGGCRRRLALAGVLTGLAYLTRLEGLFVLAAPGLWVVAGVASGRSGEAVRRVKACLPLALTLALTLAPYAVALHEVTGQWALSLKPSASNLGLGVSGAPWLAPADSPTGWPVIYADPTLATAPATPAPADPEETISEAVTPALEEGSFGLTLPWALPGLGLPDLALSRLARPTVLEAINRSLRKFIGAARLETLLLFLPGLLLLWRRDRRLALGLLVMLAGWLLVCAVQIQRSHFLANRHMILAITLIMPVAGAGVALWWARGMTTRVVVVLCLLLAAYVGGRPERSQHLPRLEALAWVTEHTEPETFIVGHRQRDGWYAQRHSITARFPFRDETLVHMLRQYDVSAMVIAQDELQRYRPHWLDEGLVVERARFGEGDEVVLVLEPRFPL